MNRIYHSGKAKSKGALNLPWPIFSKEGKKEGRIAIHPYIGSNRTSPFGKGGLRGILKVFHYSLFTIHCP
jgi:hypothetical protein